MITFFSILLFIGIVFLFIRAKVLKQPIGKWFKAALVVSIVFMALAISNPFAHNSAGYRTVVENPLTGAVWTRFDQGLFIKGFFSKTYVYPNVINTMFSDLDEPQNITAFHPPFEIRFNDATKSLASATVRWRLPFDNESMISIHKEYHSPHKLAATTLTKYTRECLKYSAQLMESETHYSGGMSKLSEDFQDQLEQGQYVLEYKTEYIVDSLTKEKRKLTESHVRLGSDGFPLRNKSDVQQFNIKIAFASVDQVDYEEQVDLKLAKKIEASTQESISKQQLITAQQEALTAKTRANETASKVEATIRGEKAVEVERLAKLQAKEYAQKVVYEGDAKAAANRALVSAGLTPQQRMEMDIKIADVVSKNIAGASTPNVVFMSSDKGSANEVMKVFGAERALELIKKMETKK